MPSRPAHFERLLNFLRRKGRSREDAEDLAQEAMLRLHVYSQDAEVTNEEAFLRHAAHNLSIDQHRRERGFVRFGERIDEGALNQSLADPAPSPERVIDAQQRLQNIRALLDSIGTRTREIYFAHRAGYSYAEIAHHLEISQITIKRHIARALLAIMEQGEAGDHGSTQCEAE